MASSHNFFVFFTFWTTFQFAQCADFAVKPTNTHFVSDSADSLEIPCSIANLTCVPDLACDYVFWSRLLSDGTEVPISFNDSLYINDGTYSIEGEFNLIIHDVTADDAGTYVCQNSVDAVYGSLEVIVLGK